MAVYKQHRHYSTIHFLRFVWQYLPPYEIYPHILREQPGTGVPNARMPNVVNDRHPEQAYRVRVKPVRHFGRLPCSEFGRSALRPLPNTTCPVSLVLGGFGLVLICRYLLSSHVLWRPVMAHFRKTHFIHRRCQVLSTQRNHKAGKATHACA